MAIVILTVGLLSLAQMMVLATNSNTLSGRLTSASALAKEQLERLKATPFYSDPFSLTRTPALADGGDIDTTVGGYVRYYDPDGQPTGVGTAMFEVRWEIQTVPSRLAAPNGSNPGAMSSGSGDGGSICGDWRSAVHYFSSRERRIVIHTLSIDRGSTNNAFN